MLRTLAKLTTWVLFIDFLKAFDSVNRNILLLMITFSPHSPFFYKTNLPVQLDLKRLLRLLAQIDKRLAKLHSGNPPPYFPHLPR
jgi:hypothetical protein